MTDKEIAFELLRSRMHAGLARYSTQESTKNHWAKSSVNIIHHIINSINWED